MNKARERSSRVDDQIVVVSILVLLLVSGLVWVLSSGPPPPKAARDERLASGKAGASVSPPAFPDSARVLTTGKDGITVMPEFADLARELNASGSTIERDFEILDIIIEGFRHSHQGGGPAGGENQEIIAQLRGQTPKHLALIPPDLPSINTQGQLLDRWGTPFYFHPLSATSLGIRSAGPDHKLWTEDDVVSTQP